jgi:hypothetical protein
MSYPLMGMHPELPTHQWSSARSGLRHGWKSGSRYTAAVWFAIGAALGGCGDEDSAPTPHSQTLAVLEEQILEGTASATDVLHRPITYSLTSGPNHGVLSLDPGTGRFSYRPDANFYGQNVFRFAASSGSLTSEPATVSIAVQPVNDAPVAGGAGRGTPAAAATRRRTRRSRRAGARARRRSGAVCRR